MGARAEKFESNTVICHGGERLLAPVLMATDLRASGEPRVLAGCIAEGTTIVIAFITSIAYELIEDKLRALGARILNA